MKNKFDWKFFLIWLVFTVIMAYLLTGCGHAMIVGVYRECQTICAGKFSGRVILLIKGVDISCICEK